MLLERVLAHFSALGWTLADETTIGAAGAAFHPDLLLAKDTGRLAVRLSEETLGTYQVGLFGAKCRRAKVKGIVVCESSPDVLEACESAGLDFLAAQDIGEPVVVPVAKPRPIAAEPAAEKPLVRFEEFAKPETSVPWWRWAVVAVIWVAALTVSTYWLTLVV